MPIILAVETSTEACSAALYFKDAVISRYAFSPRQHGRLMLSMCQELLQEADILCPQLSAVAFGQGPGSFTGVRLSAAAAQGIAVAHDLPVIGVSSLQAIAQTAYLCYQKSRVFSGIDARMNEIYAGEFRVKNNSLMTAVHPEKIISAEAVNKIYSKNSENSENLIKDCFYAGSAFQKENIIYPSAEFLMPQALDNWQKNVLLAPENAYPVYLRNNII